MFKKKADLPYRTGVNCQTCGKEIYSDSSLWDELFKPGNERELRKFQESLTECADCEAKVLARIEQRVIRQDEYRAYLQTSHWQKTRQEAIARADGQCQRCRNSYRLEVHHKTYTRLGKERPQDLEVLCADCHGRQHGKKDSLTSWF